MDDLVQDTKARILEKKKHSEFVVGSLMCQKIIYFTNLYLYKYIYPNIIDYIFIDEVIQPLFRWFLK